MSPFMFMVFSVQQSPILSPVYFTTCRMVLTFGLVIACSSLSTSSVVMCFLYPMVRLFMWLEVRAAFIWVFRHPTENFRNSMLVSSYTAAP